MPGQVRFLFPGCAPQVSVFLFLFEACSHQGRGWEWELKIGALISIHHTSPGWRLSSLEAQEMHYSSVTLGFCQLRSPSFKGNYSSQIHHVMTFVKNPKTQLITQLHLNSEFSTQWLFSGWLSLKRHLLLSFFLIKKILKDAIMLYSQALMSSWVLLSIDIEGSPSRKESFSVIYCKVCAWQL